MCNTIDFFTILNDTPNAEQVIANNFTSLWIIVFKFDGISQRNKQSKEVVSVLNSFQFQTLYFCSLVYLMNVSTCKLVAIPVYEHI